MRKALEEAFHAHGESEALQRLKSRHCDRSLETADALEKPSMGGIDDREQFRRQRRVGLDQVRDVVDGDVVVLQKTRQFGCDGRERRNAPERPVPVIGSFIRTLI